MLLNLYPLLHFLLFSSLFEFCFLVMDFILAWKGRGVGNVVS